MAELDPGKVGTLGVDPGTGSPLSQEVRNALLKKSTIDRSIFRNELLESENRKREIDTQNSAVIQSQEQALSGFNSNIQALRNDISKLGTGLAGIASLLQQDNAEEVSRTRRQQENERRLTEQKVRIGKESQVEQNIQNALVTPVNNLVPKLNDVFGNIKNALAILFGGWLTKQVVDAMNASEEGNTELFDDIKNNIIKNLAIVGGGLLAIKVGFSLVKTTISRIAFGLTRLLIAKPLALAAGLLRINGGGPKTTGPGPKSGRGGNFGGVGRFVTFLSVLMNLKNKEFVDATLGALSLAARAPGPLGAIGKIAGIAFTADEIAEAFGKNIFTDSGFNQKVDEIAKIFTKGDQNNKPTVSPKPTPSSTTPAPPCSTTKTNSIIYYSCSPCSTTTNTYDG